VPALLAVLAVATIAAFLPVLGAELLHWDDTRYVVKNELLRSFAACTGLWDPFSPALVRRALQYYPVTFSSFCIEYQLAGTEPGLYHATNLALHAANAMLALLLVRQMGASAWVAAATAAVFALHPAQVASVAWIAERKNVLSGFFYFLAFLLYLRHRESGRTRPYVLSLLAFAAALLSKSQTATLPVAIGAYELLRRDAARLRRLPLSAAAGRLAPMLGMALVAGLLTANVERQLFRSWWDLPSLPERPLVAASAAWFYVGKFLVPVDLAPIYPKWDASVGSPIGWLALAAWALAGGLLVLYRRRIAPLVLWGAAQFVLSLAPILGLVAFSYQHFAYVADHFLYLSCFGGGLAVAVLADQLAGVSAWTARRWSVSAAGGLVLVALGAATQVEARHWKNDLTFSRRALERNPESHAANLKFGIHSFNATPSWEAVGFIKKAYEMAAPNGFEYDRALEHYLNRVEILGGPEAVVKAATEELSRNPSSRKALGARAEAYEKLGRSREALADRSRLAHLAPSGSK
jgi:tetratricopeptide (TPR) repeat protein